MSLVAMYGVWGMKATVNINMPIDECIALKKKEIKKIW